MNDDSKQILYKKLPGTGRRFFEIAHASSKTLWMGPDHLLHVTDEYYEESYKRFYLKDIQVLAILRTNAWLFGNILLGLPALAFLAPLLVGVTKKWDTAGLVALGIFAATFLLLFLVNWLRGPTCKCFLSTAVQTEELLSLNRLRRARKVVRQIRQAVEAAQGTLAVEELESRRLAAAPGVRTTAGNAVRPATPVASGTAHLRHCHGSFHLILFCLLILDLIDTAAAFIVEGGLIREVAANVVLPIVLASNVTALIKQSGTDLPKAIKSLTWSALGYLLAALVWGGIMGAIMVLEGGRRSLGAVLSPDDSMSAFLYHIFSLVAAAGIGIPGLIGLYRFRRQTEVPPPPPRASDGSVSGIPDNG